jgi:hypothetical protein
MKPVFPKPGTQASKVLKVLLDAEGGWVSKQVFIRQLYLTQAGARIFELENEYGWQIEHSDFTDEHGFRSYRIKAEEPATLPLIS